VEVANYNSPQQTVVAGDAVAVEVACTLARRAGAKRAIPLQVSAPFHTSLMAPAALKLGAELERVRFSDPTPPVVTNVEAEPNASGARVGELLCRQVTAPVRFTDVVRRMAALGVGALLEVGPGRVLSGLVARIDPRLARAGLGSWAELSSAADFVYQNR
jgi:[acyl-carrier-protein] S-malonyltransferase